jgi:hypothetical protein
MKVTFDDDYPAVQFQNLKVSIEFPIDRTDYPSVWVDFEMAGQLQNIGVAHQEMAIGSTTVGIIGRWRFQGYAVFTILALTSLERDLLFDEVLKVMAFGKEVAATAEFRNYIEANDLIACNFDFDQVAMGPPTATAGTPWGTDEMVYGVDVRMECVGEFVSDGLQIVKVPISKVVVIPEEAPAGPPSGVNWR